MEDKTNFSKTAMYYGAIIGGLLALFMYFSYIFNVSTQQAIGYIQYAIIVFGLYLSQKKFRDNNLSGNIVYSKALAFGTLTIFFSSLILGFFTYILYSFIDPSLIDKIIVASEELMYERGLNDDEIETAIALTRQITTPLFLTFSTIIGISLLGFLFSLMTSLFIKKKSETFEDNFN